MNEKGKRAWCQIYNGKRVLSQKDNMAQRWENIVTQVRQELEPGDKDEEGRWGWIKFD